MDNERENELNKRSITGETQYLDWSTQTKRRKWLSPRVQESFVGTIRRRQVGMKYKWEENVMKTRGRSPKLGELEWQVRNVSPRPSPHVKHLMLAKHAEDPDQNEYDGFYVTNRIQIGHSAAPVQTCR